MGKAGGIALVQKRGKDYMRELGRKGAKRFWQLYHMRPAGTSSFAIVSRETGEVKSYNPGYERYGK